MRRLWFVPITVVASVATLSVASLGAAGGEVSVRKPAETRPALVSSDRPVTTIAVDVRGASRGAGAARAVRPGSVDAATYAREKRAAATAAAPTGASEVPVRPTASVPLTFNGLNRQTAQNNGFVFVPPDTTLGKSPTRVLEGTNSALRLFNTSGGVIQTSPLNAFYGAATGNGLLFDPKVYYDRNATNPRLFVVALQRVGNLDTNTANNVSRIWIAVSRSSNPANLNAASWCRYNIEGRREIGTANVSWADYPEIGAGRDSFSFATNQFRFTNDGFRFAVINVWNKTVAENNASSCPTVPRFTFQPSATAGNFSRFTIQPAQHYTSPSSFTGTTNPAYYLATTRGSSNQYHVLRVRNVASGSPTLATLSLTGTAYAIPPSAKQPGTSVLIDSGDNRMLQVAGIGNNVIGTFTTSCQFTANTAVESCSLTPRVVVGQNASGALTASIAENTFSGLGDNFFVHHNSIATNTALRSATVWVSSGTSRFDTSTVLIKNVNAGWTSVSNIAPGTCALPGPSPARSGDYTGAQLDPSDTTGFWLAGEEAITISGSCQWQTRVAHLLP